MNLAFPTVEEKYDFFMRKSEKEVFRLAMQLSPILITENSIDLVSHHFGYRPEAVETLFLGFSILKPRYTKSRLLVFDFISDGTLNLRRRFLNLAYTYLGQQVVRVTELMAKDLRTRKTLESFDNDECIELQKLAELDFISEELNILNGYLL